MALQHKKIQSVKLDFRLVVVIPLLQTQNKIRVLTKQTLEHSLKQTQTLKITNLTRKPRTKGNNEHKNLYNYHLSSV